MRARAARGRGGGGDGGGATAPPALTGDDPAEIGSEREESSTFRAEVEKVEGKLGLAYRAEIFGLVITGIHAGYGVGRWNASAAADRVLCAGDVIVAVDEVEVHPEARAVEQAGCLQMVEAMAHATGPTRLKVLRRGPRWHLGGVVADCLGKMHLAGDLGIKVELDSAGLVVGCLVSSAAPAGSSSEGLTRAQSLLVAVAVVLPSALTLALWSAVGVGFELFHLLAPEEASDTGFALLALAGGLALCLYLLDWAQWESGVPKTSTALLVLYPAGVGGILQCGAVPEIPLLFTLAHLPVLLGLLRATSLKDVSRTSFYRLAALLTALTGVLVLALWLLWAFVPGWDPDRGYGHVDADDLARRGQFLYDGLTVSIGGAQRSLDYRWDCKLKEDQDFTMQQGQPVGNGHQLTTQEWADRASACGAAMTTWFLLWVSPVVAAAVDLLVAAFCFISGSMRLTADTARGERAIVRLFAAVAFVSLALWAWASIAAPDTQLATALLALLGLGVAALLAWLCCDTVGAKILGEVYASSRDTLVPIVTSDWFRALVVMVLSVLIPAMFVLEMLHQKVRRLRSLSSAGTWLTEEAAMVWEGLRNWRWVSIAIKVNWLVLVYWVVLEGIPKVTGVFLAWLNEELERNVPFGWVLVVLFAVGFALFLLPPVIGPVVYAVLGIIIPTQARNCENIGFFWGIIIACAHAWGVKMASCVSQYNLGLFLGKSTRIMQICQVDSVPMRAVEKIFAKKGCSVSKVAVLLGTPDWPVSVLCGVLRMRPLQMFLGQSPVIFISSTCVIATSFLVGPRKNLAEGDKSLWDALASTALVLATLQQLATLFFGCLYIQAEVREHGEELAAHRPEHDKVVALNMAEQEYSTCYEETCEVQELSCFWLGLCFTSTALFSISLVLVAFMESDCFHPFQMRDRITDPDGLACPQGDLGCGFVRIVQPPLGWVALGLLVVACLLHSVLLSYLGRRAQDRLAKKRAEHGEAEEEEEEQEQEREEAGASEGASWTHKPTDDGAGSGTISTPDLPNSLSGDKAARAH